MNRRSFLCFSGIGCFSGLGHLSTFSVWEDMKRNIITKKKKDEFETIISRYDDNDNLIYEKCSTGLKWWYKYDRNNNQIYFKNSYGWEHWNEYDENNRLIHYKAFSSYGVWGGEHWYKYDEKGEAIDITKDEFKIGVEK